MTHAYDITTGTDWFTLTITNGEHKWTSEPVHVGEGRDVEVAAKAALDLFSTMMERKDG